jgi:hypothetical protein
VGQVGAERGEQQVRDGDPGHVRQLGTHPACMTARVDPPAAASEGAQREPRPRAAPVVVADADLVQPFKVTAAEVRQ